MQPSLSPGSAPQSTTSALEALNAVGATPSADEVLGPYAQAFHLTPEAEATIRALTAEAKRAHVVGWSQAQLAHRAGVARSTVSEVVDRLRSLDLVATAGGDYHPTRRRRNRLRYRLRWSEVIELSEGRLAQGHLCAAALESGSSPEQIRAALARGETPGRISRPEPRQNEPRQ